MTPTPLETIRANFPDPPAGRPGPGHDRRRAAVRRLIESADDAGHRGRESFGDWWLRVAWPRFSKAGLSGDVGKIRDRFEEVFDEARRRAARMNHRPER